MTIQTLLLSFGTLVLGFVGALATEDLRDRRQRSREAIAREEERRDRASERRVQFERESLAELQAALQRLGRTCARVHFEDEMHSRAASAAGIQVPYGRQQLSADVNTGEHDALTDVIRLNSRVSDERTRKLVATFLEQVEGVVAGASLEAARAAYLAALGTFKDAVEAIGETLRSDYD
jgi:hypothetical protein